MDCSWLVENDSNEDQGSESDPEETQAELEARLYSIVHHSDLSQPLPPELAKHYSIQCGDDGKLTVALNDSLENVKSEEVKIVDHLVKCSEISNEISEVVETECPLDRDDVRPIWITDNPYKKFRYSDVNLNSNNQFKAGLNGTNESYSDIDYSDLNYFKISQSFLNKKKIKKLKDLVIPPLFQTSESPDWKDTANASFISVTADTSGKEKDIIDQMVCALKKANPKENKGKLYFLARALFFHNRKKYRQLVKRKKTKTKVVDKTLNSSLEIESEHVSTNIKVFNETLNTSLEIESEHIRSNSKSSSKHRKSMDMGSVSLNISPFKPLPTTVDLVSEDEVDSSLIRTDENSSKWVPLPECEIPKKWTKKMTKFYTKPSGRKKEVELSDIFEDLRRRSTAADWRVDPRDEIGIYQRTPLRGKHRNRRCPNCHQHGHLMHECPSPRKIPTCFLCGLSYHTAHSCPNKICLKCGVYVTNESYECSSCYYNTFNYDVPCEVCGQITHRSEICPDLWRSFHATVDGDKKIPQLIKENKRKYCCNCANKGHFSHQCPFPSSEGEHISSFVTNYSASHCEQGTTEIVIPNRLSYAIEDTNADRFLQHLSNSINAVIDIEEGETDYILRVSGTFEQCRRVRSEIEEYVNTRKRKRKEPYLKKKRRKIM